MKNTKRIIMLALFVGMGFMSNAQKFGYINSAALLSELPAIKTADQQLLEYQKQLMSKGEAMVKSFETKYTAYSTEANSGTLSQVQVQQKEAELATEQQEIQKFELEVQQQLVSKREELYKPILDNLKNVLDGIGADEGYYMIFDASAGGLLHADTADDVMPLMRQKLGL